MSKLGWVEGKLLVRGDAALPAGGPSSLPPPARSEGDGAPPGGGDGGVCPPSPRQRGDAEAEGLRDGHPVGHQSPHQEARSLRERPGGAPGPRGADRRHRPGAQVRPPGTRRSPPKKNPKKTNQKPPFSRGLPAKPGPRLTSERRAGGRRLRTVPLLFCPSLPPPVFSAARIRLLSGGPGSRFFFSFFSPLPSTPVR